jgi:hypothetical protein
MSLGNRLKNLQLAAEPVIPDLSDQTISSLENLTITFGQKHKGRKFHEVWADQEWVLFMANRYAKSGNPDHQKFIKYIDLMVTHHEEQQLPITMNGNSAIPGSGTGSVSQTIHGLPKARAKAKSMPRTMGYNVPTQVPNHLPDLDPADAEWESHSMTYPMEYMTENSIGQSPEFQAMSQRLLQMENALQQVIGHLEHQAQGTHPAVEEEIPS